jgi:hypothetical protein
MEILLKRTYTDKDRTLGLLFVDTVVECFTVEDTVRAKGVKVYAKTAISAGRYEVVITFSNRFKKLMPLLLKVPNFEGVRIHAGNTELDTEGCLIVGQELLPNNAGVGKSRLAYNALFSKIQKACKKEKVFITIEDKP